MKNIIRKVAAFTIGCRLNQADTALIFDRLEKEDFEIVDTSYEGEIGILIINSCTVTSSAAVKSRNAVRKFRKLHPECCIVLTGCSAEVDTEIWQKELGVSLVVPNSEKRNIVEYLDQYFANKMQFGESLIISRNEHIHETKCHENFLEEASTANYFKSRAFLKVQEGCNNFCSYCIVPYARGRERSREYDELEADFKQLLAQGYKEIILTGVNVSSYSDRKSGKNLVDLVEALTAIEGDFRVRLSSTEPHKNNRDLLPMMAKNSKVCNFLHLSLQHGADTILKAMNRQYSTTEYAEFVAEARRLMPNIHIGTDVIIGFPGETEEDFEKSCQFIEEINFANIHIFTYSPRKGTPAASYKGQVSKDVAKERYKKLSAIAQKSANKYVESQIGVILRVLFEERSSNNIASGWSDNYVRIEVQDNDQNEIILEQQLYDVKVKEFASENVMRAELLKK
ncbi:tRNA (N(6)-L-threonylcarbamoyladenosine(37)-C(2))-methylthiotransferase MtaB [Lentisphaerota bacterium WC36G]|nr:tRNA (N(6)-L-threonylcarbamoyladenosine(37)-C(2))-methylthiotransferase MtaB [Lentisphaerae bacterium WC36]